MIRIFVAAGLVTFGAVMYVFKSFALAASVGGMAMAVVAPGLLGSEDSRKVSGE